MPKDPHTLSRMVYNGLVVPAAVAAYHLSGRFSAKAGRGLRGRRGVWDRLQAAQTQLRGCVWFHAASVGEYEQARPLLRELRSRFGSEIPTLQTVFSPSGYDFAMRRKDADVVEYLPLDRASSMRRMIEMLEPRALVFLKFDCWPNLVWEARHADVPVLLLDGTLQRRSLRLRGPARGFFGHLFDCFHAIGAISDLDAQRFHDGLGTVAPVTVTGDTRTDQVIHRWESAARGPLASALASMDYRYLALGSIWPADEEVVLEAALAECALEPSRGIVLVPHEPTPDPLARLRDAAAGAGLHTRLLSELFDTDTGSTRVTDRDAWRCVLVDCVGVLAEIYRAVGFSYVGGSFSTGVHNVLEPAVCGQPVLFGPRIHNAYEAERLVERKAGFVVASRSDAAREFARFYSDEGDRAECGGRAAEFVLAQRGATAASLELLRPHLDLPESG